MRRAGLAFARLRVPVSNHSHTILGKRGGFDFVATSLAQVATCAGFVLRAHLGRTSGIEISGHACASKRRECRRKPITLELDVGHGEVRRTCELIRRCGG